MKPAGEDEDAMQRRRSSIRKSRTGMHAQKKPKLDATQYTMCIGSCFLVSWGLAVTVLLLRLGIMYTFDTIRLTREEYSLKGASEWAKTKASRDVMQAVDVWNVINASIVGLVYKSPQDYSNLAAVLSPAFDLMPSLHSVEFGYTDRDSEVVVTRNTKLKADASNDAKVGVSDLGLSSVNTDIRESSSFMQSDSADCFLMGIEGCVNSGGTATVRADWFNDGSALKPTRYGGSFAWQKEPDLVVESVPGGGDKLFPSMRLLFKVSFPMHSSTVVGRITVKAAALGGNRLVDSRLGDEGKVYLCDATGAMMASKDPGDVLTVEDGIVRYKTLWEVDGGTTSGVQSAFDAIKGTVNEMTTDGDVLVAVEPLESPLDRFGIVVIAPSLTPFQHAVLIGTAALASIVAPAPYAIVGAVALVFFSIQCFQTMMKTDGKVGIASMESTDIARRVSIKETMPGHKPMGAQASVHERSSILAAGKVARMKSFMHRLSRTSR